jgi:hypothetical protein
MRGAMPTLGYLDFFAITTVYTLYMALLEH